MQIWVRCLKVSWVVSVTAMAVLGCKTTDSNLEDTGSTNEAVRIAEGINVCTYAKTLASSPDAFVTGVPQVDAAVKKLLKGSGPDSYLINETPKARFDYLKALVLRVQDHISTLLAQKISEDRDQMTAKQGYNEASYVASPPTSSEVANAKERAYWLHNPLGVCQDCSQENLTLVKTILEKKAKELETCEWEEPIQGADFVELDLAGTPTITEAAKAVTDFIKTEDKAEKLCDVGLYYSFGDNVQCAHSYVKEACHNYLAEGQTPQLDDPGIEKLKDVLQSCVTAYGGERAGKAARLTVDTFHNSLKDGDSYAQAAAEAACAGGAALIGEKVQSTPQVNFETACQDLSPFSSGFFSKERAAACFNTSASICRIAFTSGSLGLYETIPGGKSIAHDEARKIIYAAEGALCKKSVTTSIACNAINEAGKQIYQAVATGNNDWAHCVGTDKLGACIGNLYGSQGWTNNNGVATAQQTASGTTYRACCWCKRKYYANDHWIGKDTMYKSENWFSVIQQGDVQSGNCGFQDGRVIGNQPMTYNGHDVYYKYEECGKWYVKGDQCAVENGTTQQVWNAKGKSWFKVNVP